MSNKQYMNCGDLCVFIKSEGNKLNWYTKLNLLKDVAEGMHYAHTQFPPVVHRDLKSPNIVKKTIFFRSNFEKY